MSTANYEDQVRDLLDKNGELAQEVQFWKMTAGQKEKEKLDLMKEVNELRLKLSILRSGGAAHARKLDAALQASTEEALSHLVQASGAVARTLELTKQYMRDREELDSASPRWNPPTGTTSTDKVNRVPPLLLGGQSIQPVVSLSRTLLNNRSMTRSPNQNSGVTHRALPIHMLQDVYIPLRRIDASDLPVNAANDEELEQDNSAEDIGLEDSNEQEVTMSENNNTLGSDLDGTRRLDAVIEDLEPEDVTMTPPRASENPLEGPSWLLDAVNLVPNSTTNRSTLEPDSTTRCDTRYSDEGNNVSNKEATLSQSQTFTPTVRRRKRSSARTSFSPEPLYSPRPQAYDCKISRRIPKVMVAKMRLSDDPGGSGDSTPPKRSSIVPRSPRSPKTPRSSRTSKSPRASRSIETRKPRRAGKAVKSEREQSRSPRFDAPSPNGTTDARVIVYESTVNQSRGTNATSRGSGDSVRESRCGSEGTDEARTRRHRGPVNYKEKPLNRKLRR